MREDDIRTLKRTRRATAAGRLLAKAFHGELVPQDPNDKPAAALFEHICEVKAIAPKPERARRKKKA